MNNDTEQIFLLNPSDNQSTAESQKNIESTSNQVNLENVEDFTNVCRTCASITDFVIPIFMGEGLQNNLADKIHKHLPIQVSEEDLLPQVVCYQCASTLLAWHELVQCCVQADAALKTRLAVILAKDENTNNENHDDKNLEIETKGKLNAKLIQDILTKHFQMSDTDLESSGLEFICEKCSNMVQFSTLESFIDHLLLNHGSECEDISMDKFVKEYVSIVEVLATEDKLSDEESNKDVTTVKLQRFQCPFCESAFSSTTRLFCHLNQHVPVRVEDGVKCCDSVYYNTKSLIKHLGNNHVNSSIAELNVCQSCGFNAKDTTELQEHISSKHEVEREYMHNKDNKYERDKCQKYIPAVCPECNKTFSNKYNMLVHMRSHNADAEDFPCDRCSKSYKSQASLRNHQKVAHEGILNFHCPYCGEAFPSRLACDVHKRIHTGVKPYSCMYCQKSYRAKNTLDRHIEMHLDIRKYECSICSKKFRKSTHLDYHLNTHKRKK
ncbi:zinc finger protein 37 homolog isoform X2 [Battus philenor]|uniref:zinc finger protein 37 homolog isoform X2 n=1 Tax=Battus philenor TaxID=42288 RepID=UPI0035D11EE4